MSPRRLLSGFLQALLALGAVACQAQPQPAPRQDGAPAVPSPFPPELPPESAPRATSPALEALPPSDEPVDLMLARVNADRGAAAPLVADKLLAEVVQDYVDELSRQNLLPSGDVSQRLIDRLNQRGYKAYRVVISFAQIGGDFAPAIERWRQGDRGTFQRLENGELRDFALGIGAVHDQPLYVAVGAVRQQQHYEAETADLRSDLEKLRQEELRRVNALRAERRREGLQRHPSLDLAAQSYAEDMLRRGFYGHYSPEGQDVGDRVRQARYLYRKVGENIASGQTSVGAVMSGWIDSPDHLHNLLDREFTEIGIGFAAGPTRDGSYGFLWVQVFGAPRR